MKKYTEISKGLWEDNTYVEKIIKSKDLLKYTRLGWKETLWSNVQPEIVATKWKNAINAMENMED